MASHNWVEVPKLTEITAKQKAKAAVRVWPRVSDPPFSKLPPPRPEPPMSPVHDGLFEKGLVTKSLLRPWEFFEGPFQSDDKCSKLVPNPRLPEGQRAMG